MEMPFSANDEKILVINTDFGDYARYPVKTHVIMADDELEDVLDKYAKPYLQEGDYIFLSEKIVAITQGRVFPVDEIHPSWWARTLSKFVTKTPVGIGLGMPCTMELAIRDIGLPKILFAAFCSFIPRLFGVRGVFYNILGEKARAIDGPCDYTIPPYNNYAKLAPAKPNEAAKKLADYIGYPVAIVDANDAGIHVLGRSDMKDINETFCEQVFRDNPLAQANQQTPVCIVRKINAE